MQSRDPDGMVPINNKDLIRQLQRGADLSDHSPDKGLLKKWPKDGPKQVWLYKDAGIGYSGPAISNGKFITMGERDGAIHVIAIDTKNGKEIWNTKFAKG